MGEHRIQISFLIKNLLQIKRLVLEIFGLHNFI
jgi:hypothetical protein